jgi:hypothetical protein
MNQTTDKDRHTGSRCHNPPLVRIGQAPGTQAQVPIGAQGGLLACTRSSPCDGVREIAGAACGRRAAHDLRDQARSVDSDAQLTGRLSAAHSPDAGANAPLGILDIY